jgi:putative transposase
VVSLDQQAVGSLVCGLALPAAGCGPQRIYAWRQRQQNPGPRARENAVITTQVQVVFDHHRGFYGAPRVHQELRATGLKVGRHRVARLMRKAALKAKTRRGFRPCRNRASNAAGVAENLLLQDFSPLAANRCWAGDITYHMHHNRVDLSGRLDRYVQSPR